MPSLDQELKAFYDAVARADAATDLEAGASLIHFPLSVTNVDEEGNVSFAEYTKENWSAGMKPRDGRSPATPEKPMLIPQVIARVGNDVVFTQERHTISRGSQQQDIVAVSQLVRIGGSWALKSVTRTTKRSTANRFNPILCCIFRVGCCWPGDV